MTHYGHNVWDDEDGTTYYLAGHVPTSRAIAAVNRYCRTECGLTNIADEHGAPLSYVTVKHVYWRREPTMDDDQHMVQTDETDLWGKPFTEVTV